MMYKIEAQAVRLPCLLFIGYPIESKVNSLVKIARIDSGVKSWVDKIITKKNLVRAKYNKDVKEAGDSLYNLDNKLEILYLK